MSTLGQHKIVGTGFVEVSRDTLLEYLSGFATVSAANEELFSLTGVPDFFPDQEAFDDFPKILSEVEVGRNSPSARERGDFQTPPDLAARVCQLLAESGCSPDVVVEPSYGTGNFIFAALSAFPSVKAVYGVELLEAHEWQVKIAALVGALIGSRHGARIELHRASIFGHRFGESVLRAEELLIVGNPPWVTNSELGGLGSANLPTKRNIKSLNGLDAVTGKSNFDICEYVLLRMLDLLAPRRGTLAMLCKNSVVKNVVEGLPKREGRFSEVRQVEIDARREFGVAVGASLLLMKTGRGPAAATCAVSALGEPGRVKRIFGWSHGKFVSHLNEYEARRELDGASPSVWRQGLKHDCARVMELDAEDGHSLNGMGERVEVELENVYPLLKSSDLRKFAVGRARKSVIVTQRKIGEDTTRLQETSPKLWRYLKAHEARFEGRKSSIYRNKPPFSLFGIGDYAFATYKVAVSGLYKEPRFSLAPPVGGKPVMFDDTCYYLGFESYADALFTAALLNTTLVARFLQSIVFTDAKRPYTKELLMRVDLRAVAGSVTFNEARDVWRSAAYEPAEEVAEEDYSRFLERLISTGRGFPLF